MAEVDYEDIELHERLRAARVVITEDAADEIERLQAIVATVDDLHSCRLAHDTCLACDHDWPCPTHLLIHPEEARRG